MGLRPAKSHEKLVLQDWWGGPPWSAADAPVGLLAPRKMLMSLCRLRDQGVRPTRPRGCGFSTLSGRAYLACQAEACPTHAAQPPEIGQTQGDRPGGLSYGYILGSSRRISLACACTLLIDRKSVGARIGVDFG